MLKRTVWFSIGAASGALGSAYAYARVRETRGRVAADGLADTMAELARRVGTSMSEAVAEGRAAMRDAEARITADLDARS